MTAKDILLSLLEANKELSSKMIKDELLRHGYSLKTAYYTIQEAIEMGWMSRVGRNRKGIALYRSNLYGKVTVNHGKRIL